MSLAGNPKWATVAWARAYLRQPFDHQLIWENKLARKVLAEAERA